MRFEFASPARSSQQSPVRCLAAAPRGRPLAALLAGAAAMLLALGSAQAASTCETQAAEKKLAGAAKTSFLKKCEKDTGGGGNGCEAKAAEKKLAGAAKTSFVTKCEKEMAGGGNACEAKAAEKKLAGAAKTSFVKKCEADAKEAKAPPKA